MIQIKYYAQLFEAVPALQSPLSTPSLSFKMTSVSVVPLSFLNLSNRSRRARFCLLLRENEKTTTELLSSLRNLFCHQSRHISESIAVVKNKDG